MYIHMYIYIPHAPTACPRRPKPSTPAQATLPCLTMFPLRSNQPREPTNPHKWPHDRTRDNSEAFLGTVPPHPPVLSNRAAVRR